MGLLKMSNAFPCLLEDLVSLFSPCAKKPSKVFVIVCVFTFGTF